MPFCMMPAWQSGHTRHPRAHTHDVSTGVCSSRQQMSRFFCVTEKTLKRPGDRSRTAEADQTTPISAGTCHKRAPVHHKHAIWNNLNSLVFSRCSRVETTSRSPALCSRSVCAKFQSPQAPGGVAATATADGCTACTCAAGQVSRKISFRHARPAAHVRLPRPKCAPDGHNHTGAMT